ncbi:HET-domain-containing protein [Stipitochalara longipes BDJ]|nr:HET-domain-containing protein [Stipitochalara longipes BDJ]
MARPSILCDACKRIVLEQYPEAWRRDPNKCFYENQPHHATLSSIQQASELGCYICKTFWVNLDEHARSRLLAEGGKQLIGHSGLIIENDRRMFWFAYSLRGHLMTQCPHFNIVRIDHDHWKQFSSTVFGSDTGSPLALDIAYKWYISCQTHHKKCEKLAKIPKWCPTRLLDVGTAGDLEYRVRIASEDIPEPVDYMTLSYRWGDLEFMKLTCANIEELRLGRAISELPQTFVDAIFVARRFSIRYLWIDSLCIIQDSDQDWMKESSLMRDVYGNSRCNIAASASVDPKGGLFRARNPADVQPGFIKVSTDSIEQYYRITDNDCWDREVVRTELHGRGWVFQERLLAPRVLHFAEKQIFWECFTDQKCEGSEQGEVISHTHLKNLDLFFSMTDRVSKTDAAILWNRLVEAYSHCVLTKAGDKLVALSGLANLFQGITKDQYLAGIWRSHAIAGLNWHVEYQEGVHRHAIHYRAPSWSWASIDGPISTTDHTDTDHLTLASIVDVYLDTSLNEPTGQVFGGWIMIEGVLVHATSHIGAGGKVLWKLKQNHRWFPLLDTSAWGISGDIQVLCLPLQLKKDNGVLVGLLLTLEPGSSDIYTRIGSFMDLGEYGQKFVTTSAPKSIFKII